MVGGRSIRLWSTGPAAETKDPSSSRGAVRSRSRGPQIDDDVLWEHDLLLQIAHDGADLVLHSHQFLWRRRAVLLRDLPQRATERRFRIELGNVPHELRNLLHG